MSGFIRGFGAAGKSKEFPVDGYMAMFKRHDLVRKPKKRSRKPTGI